MLACHSQLGRTSVNILLLVNTLIHELIGFCLNKTAFPIAQTDIFDRKKNAFYDHDFTTEAIVLGNQSVRDHRLIGRAVIIITERTVFLSFLILNYEYVCLSILFRLCRVVQEVNVFHYKENPLIETNQWDIS